jgi:hypothetical protein
VHRHFWTRSFRNFWRIQDLIGLLRELWGPITQCWAQMNTPLTSLADGANLLFPSPPTVAVLVTGD